MTFSDRKVAEFVEANFVAVWHNRGPGFHNEDYSTEHWIFRTALEAYPTKNICTFFLTPEGKVFHYLAGFWAPEPFLLELEIAREIRRAAFDEKMELRRNGLEVQRRLHESAAARIGREILGLALAPRSYRGALHEHSDSCREALEAGSRYLIELHRHWSRSQELPDFGEVQYRYLFGNSFTEEPRNGGATRILGTGVAAAEAEGALR